MKKFFVSVLAVAALAACNKAEIVETQSPSEIAFAGSFIDKATRSIDPSTTTASLNAFDVWAFMDDASGVVFNDEDVTGRGHSWSYVNTQYWLPSHTYYFAALAPMNSPNIVEELASGDAAKNGLGKVTFTNQAGTEDLIYAATSVTTSADINDQPEPVKFQFSHLLSKVKFSFSNEFDNNNAYVTVENIRMEVAKTATIDLSLADWWSTNQWKNYEGTTTLEFGNMEVAKIKMGGTVASEYERLTFPVTSSDYLVTFDVKLHMGEVLAYSNTLTTKIQGAELCIGKAYNFHANISAKNITPEGTELYPITFDVVEVKEWENGNGYDGGEVNTGSVAPLEQTTVAVGATLTLTADAISNKGVDVLGTFDGDGNTLYAGIENELTDNALLRPAGDATIQNVTLDGGKKNWNDNGTERGMRAIYATKGGNYTINNVVVNDATYALNIGTSEAVTLNVTNSTLEGWTSYGTSTTATFENVAFTAGEYATLRPQGKTLLKDCSFVENFNINLDLMQGAFNVTGNINGGGAKVTVADARVDNGIIRPIDGATISNLTVVGGDGYKTADDKGLRAFFIEDGGDYVLDGVTVADVTYAINVNTTQAVTLEVKNSTLQGWVSYGNSTTASFTNVAFVAGTYSNFKPYTSTVLTGCSFEEGCKIDLTALTGTLTLQDCRYKGAAITAQNIAALGIVEGDLSKLVFNNQ